MSWRPEPTITLDGEVAAAGDVIDIIKIVSGRESIDVQPRAGYAVIQFYDRQSTRTPARLTAPVTVAVEAGDGTVQLFAGEVSDAKVEYQSDGVGSIHTITAVGPLARVNRARVDAAGYPEQKDGDRVAAVLATIAISWEQAGAYSWAEFPERSWADADPVPVEVDTPGQYMLAPDDDSRDPFGIIQQAANDGMGQLSETRTGGIRYTDAIGRLARSSGGFFDLPADAMEAGLSTMSSMTDLINDVTVQYSDLGTTAEVTARDDDAIADLGGEVLSVTVSTMLSDAVDAQDRADRTIALYARPARSIESITLLVSRDLTTEVRRDLLELEDGDPVRARQLPVSVGTDFAGFVEGRTWILTSTSARITLNVSDWRLSEQPLAWSGVAGTLAWQDADPTVDWTTAQELTSA